MDYLDIFVVLSNFCNEIKLDNFVTISGCEQSDVKKEILKLVFVKLSNKNIKLVIPEEIILQASKDGLYAYQKNTKLYWKNLIVDINNNQNALQSIKDRSIILYNDLSFVQKYELTIRWYKHRYAQLLTNMKNNLSINNSDKFLIDVSLANEKSKIENLIRSNLFSVNSLKAFDSILLSLAINYAKKEEFLELYDLVCKNKKIEDKKLSKSNLYILLINQLNNSKWQENIELKYQNAMCNFENLAFLVPPELKKLEIEVSKIKNKNLLNAVGSIMAKAEKWHFEQMLNKSNKNNNLKNSAI